MRSNGLPAYLAAYGGDNPATTGGLVQPGHDQLVLPCGNKEHGRVKHPAPSKSSAKRGEDRVAIRGSTKIVDELFASSLRRNVVDRGVAINGQLCQGTDSLPGEVASSRKGVALKLSPSEVLQP